MWKNRLVSAGAITDASGNVTDTFAYDTYGKLIARTGETDTVFLYDGRDGVSIQEGTMKKLIGLFQIKGSAFQLAEGEQEWF